MLVPVEDEQLYQVTPLEVLPAHRVRPWVRGIVPLPGTDSRIFHTEVPLAELRSWSGEERPVPEED